MSAPTVAAVTSFPSGRVSSSRRASRILYLADNKQEMIACRFPISTMDQTKKRKISKPVWRPISTQSISQQGPWIGHLTSDKSHVKVDDQGNSEVQVVQCSSSSSVLEIEDFSKNGQGISWVAELCISTVTETEEDENVDGDHFGNKSGKHSVSVECTMDKRETGSGGEKESSEYDQYVKDFERQLLYWPGSVFPTSKQLLSSSTQVYDYNLADALALAKKAVLASKAAASLAQETNLPGEDIAEPFLGLEPPSETEITVRSGRLLERRSKKRGVSKSKVIIHEASHLKLVDMQRKTSDGGFDQSDPLGLFLSGSRSRQLLTAKQEVELFVQIQELARLEQVKGMLQSQFGREPTLFEWAEALGMSCLALQSHIHSGNRSRERMTCSNFRLVVHVAKHYQGWGINLQDLLQEGSKGLMKSIDKFKPQAGCRFSTYAYWWIRQSIKKAIFQNSRTIRLPENVYNLLKQVKNAKMQCIQDGSEPTKEELARRMGISVDKLSSLLVSTRTPLSMQQPVWTDQDTTFQEITSDSEVERPDQCVDKQMMRQHVRNFLNILSPKERRIIRLRFGIEDGKQKSLSQIGLVFGISKERVRQLESRALDKLKRSSSTQGLEAYTNLLV